MNPFAQISLKNLDFNLKQFKKFTNSKIIAVIKADAYGHGIKEIAGFLKDKVYKLAVANLEEAIKTNASNVLILQPLTRKEEISEAIERGYSFNLCDPVQLEILSNLKKTAKVEIEIDTGMNRSGIWYENFRIFFEKLKNVKIEGLYSHFSNADKEDDYFSYEQFRRFITTVEYLQLYKHICNTAGTLRYREFHLDAVRIGIGLYGVYPADFLKNFLSLKPVMTFKSRVIQVKFLKRGESVGYNLTFKADKDTRIALVSCGYADGVPYELSNNGSVYANGKLYRILGKISMDMTVIEADDLKVGDIVEFWGENIDILKVSRMTNKIPYLILTNIGKRVKRLYEKF
jgi:alanine racemase